MNKKSLFLTLILQPKFLYELELIRFYLHEIIQSSHKDLFDIAENLTIKPFY